MKKYFVGATALACALSSGSAWASTQTASLPVTATISNVCSVNTLPLAFGQVAVSGVTNGTGTINVTCTSGGTFDISLDIGQNPLGAQRRVVSNTPVAGSFLNYNIYTDSGRTNPWGTSPVNGVNGTGTGSVIGYTVYGQIPGGQPIVVGNYADTVTVTVTY